MTQTCFISQPSVAAGRQIAALEMHVDPKIEGGAVASIAVYTNAPTQPQIAQASGLCIARGQQNTHGVRTNG